MYVEISVQPLHCYRSRFIQELTIEQLLKMSLSQCVGFIKCVFQDPIHCLKYPDPKKNPKKMILPLKTLSFPIRQRLYRRAEIENNVGKGLINSNSID